MNIGNKKVVYGILAYLTYLFGNGLSVKSVVELGLGSCVNEIFKFGRNDYLIEIGSCTKDDVGADGYNVVLFRIVSDEEIVIGCYGIIPIGGKGGSLGEVYVLVRKVYVFGDDILCRRNIGYRCG